MGVHVYGRGICTDDIQNTTIDRIKSLIAMAPNVHDICHKEYEDAEADVASTPDEFAEYLGEGWDGRDDCGLATILAVVIAECERVNLSGIRDECCNTFLIMPEKMPWQYSEKEKALTEADIDAIIRKYVNVLTDEVLVIKDLDIEFD